MLKPSHEAVTTVKHRTKDWDCYATDKRNPNGDGIGENVTAQFTAIIYTGFFITLIASFVSIVELINKKMSNKQITKLVNIFDSLVVMAVAAWLAWATTVRLSRHGRLCAGGTNNVSEEVHPYAISQGSFLIVIIVLMYTIPPTLFIATNCGCL